LQAAYFYLFTSGGASYRAKGLSRPLPQVLFQSDIFYKLKNGSHQMSYFKAKMVKNRYLLTYAGRAYSASPDLLARFKGPYLAYKGGEERKGT